MSETHPLRRFALLGNGRLEGPLAELLQQTDYSIVATLLRETVLRDSASLPSWHALRDADDIDAVILTDAAADSLAAARQLAIHGKPLIVPFGPPLPEEFIAEMALYDAEGTSTLIPLLPAGCAIPVSHELDLALADGRLGELVSLQIERNFVSDSTQPPPVIHDRQLTRAQFEDVATLRRFGGNYSQVTVIRSGQTGTGFSSQTLQLAGPGLPDANCVYRAVPPHPAVANKHAGHSTWKLELTGTAATACASDPESEQPLQIDGQTIVPTQPAQKIVADRLSAAVEKQPGQPTWNDVARACDTLEAMRRSLRRRRTIDLHFETTSERSQFKTHMATIGCGVILWTMLGIIGLLFAGAVLDPRDGRQRRAEAAGFVISGSEFEPGSAELTDRGRDHLAEIASRWNQHETVVLIEQAETTDDGRALDQARRRTVRERLRQAGADDPGRVIVRSLRGGWFARAMQLARLLVFAPVGLFLIVQALLLITRPAAPPEPAGVLPN